jgi:ketosteroid isomerase-like protein
MVLLRALRIAGTCFCLLLPTLFCRSDAGAQQAKADDSAAIHDVIQGQLDAFRRDDGEAAFGFAAPGIQSMFRSPETFLEAVRQGYRPVYRPRKVEFRELKSIDGAVVQQVYVVGPDNEPKLALYIMEQQPDGSWRIAGCVLLDFEGQSA